MARVPELAAFEERSYWQATMPPIPDRTAADVPDTADVVVIGGGLTGLSAARRAAELGASVVLLEAERVGWGASTRNGGMCHPGFKRSLPELWAAHGEAMGTALYRESVEAYEHVRGLCTTGIDADFVESGHLVVAAAPSHAAALAPAAAALRRVGTPARVVAREDLRAEIGTDAAWGGLVVERSAGLHPGRLTAGLARLAEAAGVHVAEDVRVLRVRATGDGRRVVETPRGIVVARDVIVATNGYTGAVTPALRRRLLPIRSYIVVTEPLAADVAASISPRGRMFFDTNQFLCYWRLTPDGRLLFGGRASMWPTTIGRTAAILQRSMVARHPQLAGARVAYAWGGNVAFTMDRMVHAGRADGVAYAAGCCGSGVAILPWLGMRVAEWVGGAAPPALVGRRFPPVPAPYEGRPWFLPLAGEWWKAKDRLAARERRGA